MKTTTTNNMSLISRKQASAMLGVSTMTVKRYQKRGKLNPVYLSSRSIRYRIQDVQDFIQSSLALSY